MDEHHQWVALDFAIPTMRMLADERDAQKRLFESSRYWNNDSHFLGLCGEFVFARWTGLVMDTALLIDGDRGRDFVRDGRTYNVKATKYHTDPHLKQSPSEHWPDFFILVALDMPKERGRYCGFATAAMMRDAPCRDYGYGLRHALSENDLLPHLPPPWGLNESPGLLEFP